MDHPEKNMKRITVRPKCPNPLFEKWLAEWQQEAAAKGSDMQYCFGKALRSLRKYPLPLGSGKECGILDFFGNRLCLLLDRKLAEYRKTHPEVDDLIAQVPSPQKTTPTKRKNSTKRKATPSKPKDKEEDVPPKKSRSRSSGGAQYVPAWRSGPYAILLTLLARESQPDYIGYMTKSELQKEAQPLCDVSFMKPDPGSYYTGWSSMATIIKKELVRKYSNPAKFELTEKGRELAILLSESKDREKKSDENTSGPSQSGHSFKSKPATVTSKVNNTKNVPNKPSHQYEFNEDVLEILDSEEYDVRNIPSRVESENSEASSNVEPVFESVVFQPGKFDILLLVDTCETAGAFKKNHDQTISTLSKLKVPFEVKKLKVGDFTWIARHRESRVELLLPYIIERKRMDDFGGSIKDGRFHEQKFRLKQSGVQNLIYLVESYGSDQHVGLPLSTLQQAAVNTQIIDGFFVKHTTDHCQSMAYLAALTRILNKQYQSKILASCAKKDLSPTNIASDFESLMTFEEFNRTTGKITKFTVRDMFIRQLLQLKGLSVEKALAIVDRFATPKVLAKALQLGNEDMLANITFGATSRNIGPVISKSVYQLYCSKNPRSI